MHLLTPWLTGLLAALPGAPATHPSRPLPGVQDAPTSILIRAEKVIVRPGEVLEDGAVLVREGRIAQVGLDLVAPEGAQVIEGKVVCAGFIDAWSTLGLTGASVQVTRADSATRSADAFDAYGSERAREEALRAGVVAVRVQAGGASAIGGLGAVVSTGPGTDREELLILADANVGAMLGLTKGVSRRARVTDVFDRIGQVDKLVGEIKDGRDYRMDQVEYRHELEAWQQAMAEKEKELEKDFKKAKKDRDKEIAEAEEKDKEFKEKKYKEDKKPKPPKYDLEKEVMARVADGEVPLVVHAHRVAELRELLIATREYDRLRFVIAGGTEALTLADELAQRSVPVLVWPAPLGTSRVDEHEGHDLGLAGRLAEKDVPVLLGSAGPAARDLPLLAALAVGHGLDREEAFAALTYRAAKTFDVADQLGSVQRGRRADLLVLDGEPLVPTTQVRYVLVGGRVVVSPDN